MRTTNRAVLDERNRLGLGILTVAVIVVALVATVLVSGAGIGSVRYEAEFAQAARITSGDAVTIAGIQVGTVEGVRLDGTHVLVEMDVDRSVELGADTVASIKLTTLLGSRYVELRPAGSEPLAERRIPLQNSVVPYDLQEVLADATTTFEQVDAERLGATLDTLATELDGVPALLPQVLANIESLSGTVADRREQIGAILDATASMTSVVRAQQHSLGSLVRDGRDLLLELESRQNLVQRLLTATAELVTVLDSIVVDDRAQIDALIVSLNGLLRTLSDNDALFRNILQILPVPIRNFANASGTANEVDFTAPAGPMIDSWMCALAGHTDDPTLTAYLGECE
ncbi:MCE family protein [Rhodococcus coprophilus]|uniref:Mce family protein mce4c n=1 Tax=Rhodococcus coprophilus TaxID=38310 RepID=A0A2X4UAX8_9NOCA|nr:MCE family protein [Rhodococcus coprophilus]MBM7458446.1 virulence factor Mce-like protein [Rhodococcus coprophilus]SQI32518.1 mce family protein mce4c [Rhodococcus coprophilus]